MNTRALAIPAIALSVIIGSALIGYTSIAAAQTSSTTPTATSSTSQDRTFDPTKGGHVGANGVKEELLTGDTAAKVTAAAEAAQPGATIERVETDAEGAVYEAHMVKTDGSHITVKFDANYNVTATEDGPRGPHGSQ